jgi:hypothetical protein
MKIRNEQGGELNLLMVSIIFSSILFLSTLGFGIWAFVSRQDYKNNSDQKAAAAAEVAKKETAAEKDNEYVEKEKFPLKSYKAPADLGAISMSYPKTWSGYVSASDENFFIFNPDVITARDDPLYALKITVEDSAYNDVLEDYYGQVQEGVATAKAYSLPKVPSVVGVRFDGEVESGKPGALVILPLRDKTIKIACEIPDRLNDFNKIILPNISFNP